MDRRPDARAEFQRLHSSGCFVECPTCPDAGSGTGLVAESGALGAGGRRARASRHTLRAGATCR